MLRKREKFLVVEEVEGHLGLRIKCLQYGRKRSVTIFGFETQTRERVIQLGTYLPYEPW